MLAVLCEIWDWTKKKQCCSARPNICDFCGASGHESEPRSWNLFSTTMLASVRYSIAITDLVLVVREHPVTVRGRTGSVNCPRAARPGRTISEKLTNWDPQLGPTHT